MTECMNGHPKPGPGRCQDCLRARWKRANAVRAQKRAAQPRVPRTRTPPPSPTQKLSDDDIAAIEHDLARRVSIAWLAWEWDVSERTIQRIKAGNYRKTVA